MLGCRFSLTKSKPARNLQLASRVNRWKRSCMSTAPRLLNESSCKRFTTRRRRAEMFSKVSKSEMRSFAKNGRAADLCRFHIGWCMSLLKMLFPRKSSQLFRKIAPVTTVQEGGRFYWNDKLPLILLCGLPVNICLKPSELARK